MLCSHPPANLQTSGDYALVQAVAASTQTVQNSLNSCDAALHTAKK